MSNYIDEEEEIDNPAEEADENCDEDGQGGKDSPGTVRACKVPKSKAYKNKVRKSVAQMFAKGKKGIPTVKPKPIIGGKSEPPKEHRNARFL